MMSLDYPLAIRHKKGEYVWIGDFEILLTRGVFVVLELWSFRLYLGGLSCIYIFWLLMYFFLFEFSMIGGDTMICLFLFLVSHCATLIIDLYL